jgi:hypothetical protein
MSIAVKLASKFLKKMTEHIKDNTVPKEVPSFAQSHFTDFLSGPQLLVKTNVASIVPAATTTTQSEGGKKKDGKEPSRKKKKREGGLSNKSPGMGLFHTKKGISAGKGKVERRDLFGFLLAHQEI